MNGVDRFRYRVLEELLCRVRIVKLLVYIVELSNLLVGLIAKRTIAYSTKIHVSRRRVDPMKTHHGLHVTQVWFTKSIKLGLLVLFLGVEQEVCLAFIEDVTLSPKFVPALCHIQRD